MRSSSPINQYLVFWYLGVPTQSFYKKRLTSQDYLEFEKQKIGYSIIMDDVDSNDTISDRGIDSVMQGSTKDWDENVANRPAEGQQPSAKHQPNEKIIKEYEKSFRSVMKKSKKKRSRRSGREDLTICYSDMNRKDNFIFFELFALYTNNYLDDKDRMTKKKVSRLVNRSISKSSITANHI
jgi:hypothetical protein